MFSTLGIATIIVAALIAVALIPKKKRDERDTDNNPIENSFQSKSHNSNLRQQQIREEADALADQYQQKADEAWLDELSEKVATLFRSKEKPARKTTTSRKS